MLSRQCRELRCAGPRVALDGPARAPQPASGATRARSRARRAPLRAANPRARDPAGDDGRRRHAGLQLPRPAAAAGALRVRGRPRRLHRARRRDGARLGGRGASHRRPRAGGSRPRHRGGAVLRRDRARRLRGPDSRRRGRAARPARRRERHLRRRDQLDAPALRRAADARPRDGALLDRLPGFDADRWPARGLALGGRRAARGARSRGHRRTHRRGRRPDRVRAFSP